MNPRRFFLSLALLANCFTVSNAAAALRRPKPDDIAEPPQRLQSYDVGQRIDVNEVSMAVTNFGSFAFDQTTFNAGLEFPKGSGLTAAFAGGLWLGAEVGFDKRVAVAEYSFEYAPGAMVYGHADDPNAPQYKVYKLNRVYPTPAARDAALAAYVQGAVPYGAPPVSVLPDGTLGITGDQMLWSVFNDASPDVHFAAPGSTAPLGVEVQQTVFAFDRPAPLGRTVFVRYKIINKGSNLLQALRIGLWMDPDLGDPANDLVGCSPDRNLGYAYNAGPDNLYGASPPALGVDMIQGPMRPDNVRNGLTAFTAYINGTDPVNATQTFNYLEGLQANGQVKQDPVTGLATSFSFPGDPVTGRGWQDASPADKRMLLSSEAYELAPSAEQEVVYAVILGRAGSDIQSLARLFCDDDAIETFAAGGFTGPAPVSAPCPLPPSCPLSANEWEQQFNGVDGGALPLSFLAQCIDQNSLLLSFQSPLLDVRALLNSSNQSTAAGTATREYVALLANECAARYGYPVGAPLVLRPAQPVSCPGVEATSVRELLEPGFRGIEGEYLDLVPTNPPALKGVDWGATGFGGGAGAMFDFLGNGPDPLDHPDAFPDVEIRFDHSHSQMAYRYLRLETDFGQAPVNGREWRYGGFRSVPFTVWDVTHGVQLDVAFVERTVTDPDGTIRSPDQQLATFDSTWAPSYGDFGGREYLFVVNRPYTGSPASDLGVDGALLSVGSTFTYALWAELRFPNSVIDDGDRFHLSFGYRPSRGADTRLLLLASEPQGNPDVQAAYANLAQCLGGLNGQLGCCNDHQPPTLSVALDPHLLFPPNHSLKTIHATVVAHDECDPGPQFRLVSITSDEPDQGLGDEDVPNDIQGADLGAPDLEFQVRAERDENGNGRTYTVCYEASDESGNVTRQCATIDVPHDRRGRARLNTANGSWTLTIYGTATMSARDVSVGSVSVGAGSAQVGAVGSPTYVDVDNDGIEDALFTLAPGLGAGQVAAGASISARWTAASVGYGADIAPSTVTGVADASIPLAFEVAARPNPGRSQTNILYALPREGHVRIRVYDVSGRQVASLVDGRVSAGRHVAVFRPRVPQLYLYRVDWEGKTLTGRLTVLR